MDFKKSLVLLLVLVGMLAMSPVFGKRKRHHRHHHGGHHRGLHGQPASQGRDSVVRPPGSVDPKGLPLTRPDMMSKVVGPPSIGNVVSKKLAHIRGRPAMINVRPPGIKANDPSSMRSMSLMAAGPPASIQVGPPAFQAASSAVVGPPGYANSPLIGSPGFNSNPLIGPPGSSNSDLVGPPVGRPGLGRSQDQAIGPGCPPGLAMSLTGCTIKSASLQMPCPPGQKEGPFSMKCMLKGSKTHEQLIQDENYDSKVHGNSDPQGPGGNPRVARPLVGAPAGKK